MTVEELIKHLSKLPSKATVHVYCDEHTEHTKELDTVIKISGNRVILYKEYEETSVW